MIVKIKDFEAYNAKRFGRPWVALYVNGEVDTSAEVGRYTAKSGVAGELILVDPQVGQVFAYGQKDHSRGKYTTIAYCVYTEKGLVDVPADKLSSVQEIIEQNSSRSAHREVEVDFTTSEDKGSTEPSRTAQKRAENRYNNQKEFIAEVLKAIADHDGCTAEELQQSMVTEQIKDGKMIVHLKTPMGCRQLTIGRNCGLTAMGKKPAGTPKMMRNYRDVLEFGFLG